MVSLNKSAVLTDAPSNSKKRRKAADTTGFQDLAEAFMHMGRAGNAMAATCSSGIQFLES